MEVERARDEEIEEIRRNIDRKVYENSYKSPIKSQANKLEVSELKSQVSQLINMTS